MYIYIYIFYFAYMKQRDGYATTGCYNMDCPGFERANGAAVAPGASIDPVSDDKSLQSITVEVLLVRVSSF